MFETRVHSILAYDHRILLLVYPKMVYYLLMSECLSGIAHPLP
jgi:hypothetical protein